MKNVAIIFAGGTGQRMTHATKPKQFLKVDGKPILIYTLEQFQTHPGIDGIILVCVEGWIDYAEKLIRRYELNKVEAVLPGGSNGHQSRIIGLEKARELYGECLVLVHDGVRPLIDHATISKCIEDVAQYGSAVVGTPAVETIAKKNEDGTCLIIPREQCSMLRAPQCFRLGEILELIDRTKQDGITDFIDCATIMQHYGKHVHLVDGPAENIKITTPLDYFMFKGIMEIRNNKEVFGI